MKHLSVQWTITLSQHDDGGVRGVVTLYDGTTGREHENYYFSGSSSVVFQELLTVLDASIFTSLAIAEGVLPEGQLPLV